MNDTHGVKMKTVGLVLAVLMFLPGCAEKSKVKKNHAYEKWQARAETSQGYSPAPKRHAADLPKKNVEPASFEEKTGAEPAAGISAEKLLPDNKISLKMHDIDLAVLLRAMAKAAGQNIMINEKVMGKANINITQAPWDQVFLGILRTHGLTYAWEGSIIRIMTLEDMEQDLKRESQKIGFKMVEPLKTRVVKISYTEAKKLKDNLTAFLAKDENGQPLGSVMVDEHTNSLIIQAIQEDIEEILQLIDELDRPTPQIRIEAHIVEATKNTAMELGVQWGGLSKNGFWITPGANSTGVLGNRLSSGGIDPTSGWASNFPATGVTNELGLTIGFAVESIGSSILAAQLSALQQDGKLNILSSPSITTLDNQKALIESGSEIPYQTVEDGEVKIEFKKAVLSLEVIPHVIDAGALKMQIKTKKDEVDETQSVQGNPAIITKLAETNVLLFDGQTTVIGGLTKEKLQRTETGVPALKDVPLLGWLFKSKDDSESMEDLLIFITPHILKERTFDPKQSNATESNLPAENSPRSEAIPK